MSEAMLYEKQEGDVVTCFLCEHRCRIRPGRKGVCGIRENHRGTLISRVYNRPVSTRAEPIEKKPLYHFQPNTRSYSVGTVGCNFRCRWCQNFEIAQWPQLTKSLHGQELSYGEKVPRRGKPASEPKASNKPADFTEPGDATEMHAPPGKPTPPAKIVAEALRSNCRSISYTYNEPTVFFEYAYDIARLAHSKGLANVFITNGFMTSEMLDRFYPLLDAANVDMKGFRERTYRKYTGARLQPVLDNLKKMKEQGVWIEVTTLVIPGINDDPAEASEMAAFMVNELGAGTPWHLSRFFPAYKMQHVPLTPLNTLRRFRDIGHQAGLQYIYWGNVPEKMDTVCHVCGQTLISRSGLFARENRIASDGTCSACGTRIPGVELAG